MKVRIYAVRRKLNGDPVVVSCMATPRGECYLLPRTSAMAKVLKASVIQAAKAHITAQEAICAYLDEIRYKIEISEMRLSQAKEDMSRAMLAFGRHTDQEDKRQTNG